MQSVLNEESIFDTINSVLKTVNKVTNRSANGNNNSKYYIGGSISRYAKNLTMSFPVLVDDSLSIETAQMISRANEKNIASMLELLFASMSINSHDGTTGKDVIGMFHKNIDSMSADEYIDYANDFMNNYKEAAYLPSVSVAEVRDIQQEMCRILRQPKKVFPVDSFSENSIADYMCKDTFRGTIVFESTAIRENNEGRDLDAKRFGYQQWRDQYTDTREDERNKVLDAQKDRDYNLRLAQSKYQQNRDDINDKQREKELRLRKQQYTHQVDQDADAALRNDARDRANNLRDLNNLNQHRILDSDFKKANELQPTMMIINFNIVGDDDNTIVDRKSFVAGVKCRMIATTSTDIEERLLSTNKTQLSFKNLIRANTGEISFAKDFILAVDQQKLDAINDVKKGEAAKLWSTLKKRSIKNNVRKIQRDKNDATSIATLVVSQDTVNYMKSNANFDISLSKNAKMVMDRYNLLCLVIADETNEVAKFMYDGNDDFESVSYLVLSREAKDKELRKATDMLYRGGR